MNEIDALREMYRVQQALQEFDTEMGSRRGVIENEYSGRRVSPSRSRSDMAAREIMERLQTPIPALNALAYPGMGEGLTKKQGTASRLKKLIASYGDRDGYNPETPTNEMKLLNLLTGGMARESEEQRVNPTLERAGGAGLRSLFGMSSVPLMARGLMGSAASMAGGGGGAAGGGAAGGGTKNVDKYAEKLAEFLFGRKRRK